MIAPIVAIGTPHTKSSLTAAFCMWCAYPDLPLGMLASKPSSSLRRLRPAVQIRINVKKVKAPLFKAPLLFPSVPIRI
jgi:hypothetical protein